MIVCSVVVVAVLAVHTLGRSGTRIALGCRIVGTVLAAVLVVVERRVVAQLGIGGLCDLTLYPFTSNLL